MADESREYANTATRYSFCVARWCPSTIILVAVAFCYYVYVVELCIIAVTLLPLKVFYIIGLHVLLLLFFSCYYKAIFTKVARPSTKWSVPAETHVRLVTTGPQHSDLLERKRLLEQFVAEARLDVLSRQQVGEQVMMVRYCQKCQLVKPDRAHHCSTCGHCVLKFDHHCPYLNTCINFRNHKFFILFLFYAQVGSLYILLTCAIELIRMWTGDLLSDHPRRISIIVLMFEAVMFVFSTLFLLIYHLWLVFKNRTTFEARFPAVFEGVGSASTAYDLGLMNNMRQVFGNNVMLWLLPCYDRRDAGDIFKVRKELKRHLV